jgi:hypothetical protein
MSENDNGSPQGSPMDEAADAFLEADDDTGDEAPAPAPRKRQPDPDNAQVDGDDAPDEAEEADDAGEPDEDADGEDEEAETEETGGRYKVAVKDDNGEIVEKQVTLDELKSGFARHADVEQARRTFETQSRTLQAEVTQHVQRVNQEKEQTLTQLNALVMQALNVTSPADMMGLAQSDPQEYARAMARQQVLQSIQAQIKNEHEQASLQRNHMTQQQLGQQMEASKSELARRGITTAKVQQTYEKAIKSYGFTPQELGQNADWRLVLVLRDAVAHKSLEAKRPEVTTKLREAPKIAPSRLQAPRRSDNRLNQRFATGKATVDDLASFFKE